LPVPQPAVEDAARQTVPPILAAALCIKPRGLLTTQHAENVDMLKASSAVFATMRHLVMRFRYIMRGRNADKCDSVV
jgi:hypothetical protein